jgi:hypothetical protein
MYTVIFWFTSTFNTPYLYTTNIQTRIGGVMVCALDSNAVDRGFEPQSLVSFKKYMPPPLPYFKVNICPFPLPHFGSIFFAYLWSFRWPNYIVTLPRYFSFRLPHLNIPTLTPSDEFDKYIHRTSHFLPLSHWNGYSHFRSGLNWFRK